MPGGNLVQSVSRALDLLELIAASDDGLTVGQLASRTGLKRPTVHNLARTLAARGYLATVSDPVRLRLGPAAAELTQQSQARTHLQRVADALRTAAAAGPEATWLYVETGWSELRAALRMSADRPGILQRPARDVLHPYDSATALCHHAFAGDHARAEHLARFPFETYRGPLWEGFEQFEAFAARARQSGYAQPPEGTQGSFRAAAPVFGRGEELVGILGVHHPARLDHARRRRHLDVLLRHSRTLSPVPAESLV